MINLIHLKWNVTFILMAGIAVFVIGAQSAMAGLVVGSVLTISKYLFDTPTPVYWGSVLSMAAFGIAVLIWPWFEEKLNVRHGISLILCAFGIGCGIPTIVLPLANDWLLIPVGRRLYTNYKHQHDL